MSYSYRYMPRGWVPPEVRAWYRRRAVRTWKIIFLILVYPVPMLFWSVAAWMVIASLAGTAVYASVRRGKGSDPLEVLLAGLRLSWRVAAAPARWVRS